MTISIANRRAMEARLRGRSRYRGLGKHCARGVGDRSADVPRDGGALRENRGREDKQTENEPDEDGQFHKSSLPGVHVNYSLVFMDSSSRAAFANYGTPASKPKVD
jgi:hypothetical protein